MTPVNPRRTPNSFFRVLFSSGSIHMDKIKTQKGITENNTLAKPDAIYCCPQYTNAYPPVKFVNPNIIKKRCVFLSQGSFIFKDSAYPSNIKNASKNRVPAARNGGNDHNPTLSTTQVELQIKESVIKTRSGQYFFLIDIILVHRYIFARKVNLKLIANSVSIQL